MIAEVAHKGHEPHAGFLVDRNPVAASGDGVGWAERKWLHAGATCRFVDTWAALMNDADHRREIGDEPVLAGRHSARHREFHEWEGAHDPGCLEAVESHVLHTRRDAALRSNNQTLQVLET